MISACQVVGIIIQQYHKTDSLIHVYCNVVYVEPLKVKRHDV